MSDRRRLSDSFAGRSHRSGRRSRPLAVESCEPRRLLTTFTVISPLDTGAVGELRWAVNAANTTAGGDTIVFAPSVQQINLTQGELAIADALTIQGSPSSVTPTRIEAAAHARIFRVSDSNPFSEIPVELRGLHLSQGNVASFAGQGGAILNAEELTLTNVTVADNRATTGGGIANLGSLTVTNSRIRSNTATLGGGGIWTSADAATLIENSAISENVAGLANGGGLLNDGGWLGVVDGSQVTSNTVGRNGGGIAVQAGGLAAIEGSTISDNSAAMAGGGIYATGAGTTVVVGSDLLTGNAAAEGGGVSFQDRSAGTVRFSILTQNSALQNGGGVHVVGLADVNVVGTEISNNLAGPSGPVGGRGAGLFVDNAELTVSQSTISFNGASPALSPVEAGGGVYAGHQSILDITDSSITGNAARRGGGIYASPIDVPIPANAARSSISISDSQIADNHADRSGGGLHIGPNTDLTLECVSVTGNTSRADGGGIRLVGANGARRLVADVLHSNVSQNLAHQSGGGISSLGGVELTVDNTIVSRNTSAEQGGGFHLLGANDTAGNLNQTTILNSLISGNDTGFIDAADGLSAFGGGGGVLAGFNTQVLIDATTLNANQAAGPGGGIALIGSRSFRLQDSTVAGNSAHEGGGAAVLDADATFSQTTFHGNRAIVNGGGVFVQSATDSEVRILHSTLSLNSAARFGVGRGGGIFVGPIPDTAVVSVDLENSIVSENLSAPLSGFDEIFDSGAANGAPAVAARFSLVRDNTGTALPPGNPTLQGNIIGTAAAPISATGPAGEFGRPHADDGPDQCKSSHRQRGP